MSKMYLIDGKEYELIKEGCLEGDNYRTFYSKSYNKYLDIFENGNIEYEIIPVEDE